MTDSLEHEDEFTELVDANIPRVDLVGKGANGIPFLIAKSDDGVGLLSADEVRDLVAKADPERDGATTATLTVTGSSASAVMKSIYDAALRARGEAITPTPNENGKADGSMDDVTKADEPDVEVTDLVADAPGGSTAQSVPGSPDWEALDAQTALNAIGVLGRVKGALQFLADREATEGVTGDGGDYESAFDLEDAAFQIDCIIRRLAGYAATETLESDVAEEAEDITKAVAAAASLGEPLAVLEQFGPVIKAGRVLSSSNEERIRSASDSLQQVLATLPAPTTDDGESVAKSEKETGMSEVELEAAATDDVTKAKGDPLVVAYDASGKAIGIVDPDNLMPIADGASAAAPDEASTDDGGDAGAAADAAPADAAAAPAAGEDAAVVPGTATVASPAPTADDDGTVQKADAAMRSVLEEVLTPVLEQLAQHAGLGDVVKSLQERVETIAKMPDNRKSPVLNGATGAGLGALPTRDGVDAGEDGLADLRKAVEEAPTESARAQAQAKLGYAAVLQRFAPQQ